MFLSVSNLAESARRIQAGKRLDNLSDKELVITESVAGRIMKSNKVEDESSSTLF